MLPVEPVVDLNLSGGYERNDMKILWNRRKVFGLLLVVLMVIFALYPVRKMVVIWPAGHRQIAYPTPHGGKFMILYDTRREGHHATGEFEICRDGKIRFVRMIYLKPFKGMKDTLAPDRVGEDSQRIFVRQDLPPVPALHLVVSREKNQALLLGGQAIKFSQLFPEGAVLEIKTVRRLQAFWWWLRYAGGRP